VAQPGLSPRIVRFGPFEVDLKAAVLRKQGLRLRLQEQPFQVLAALLDNPGEVVAREDLVRRLWPDGTVVDFDRGLNAAVTRLRQVLSDSAETPRYVETVARRGYRFIAPLDAPPEPLPPKPPIPLPPASLSWRSWLLPSVAVLAILGAAMWWFSHAAQTPAGALVLAIEVDPFEDLEETPDGTLIRKNPNAGIDLPPAAIFAPGHWYAALLIDHETKKPMFAYENPDDADHDDDE